MWLPILLPVSISHRSENAGKLWCAYAMHLFLLNGIILVVKTKRKSLALIIHPQVRCVQLSSKGCTVHHDFNWIHTFIKIPFFPKPCVQTWLFLPSGGILLLLNFLLLLQPVSPLFTGAVWKENFEQKNLNFFWRPFCQTHENFSYFTKTALKPTGGCCDTHKTFCQIPQNLQISEPN